MEAIANIKDIEDRQLWITAFWGFGPQESGIIGFTRESDRNRLFESCNDGDLVLIYGATSSEVEKRDVRRALGFLEIRKNKLMDYEKMSDAHLEWKKERGRSDSWRYGIEIARAWEIINEIPVRHITQTNTHIAVRGDLLTGSERETALALTVKPVNVYGEPPVTDETPVRMVTALKKGPKGLPAIFGTFSGGERTDGVHYVYMMLATGPVSVVLGLEETLSTRKLVKVGYSKDPARRCKTFNDALPNTFKFRWTLCPQTFEFPDGDSARKAEKAAHDVFVNFTEYLGGEFFLGDFDKMQRELYLACGGIKIQGRKVG